MSIPEQITPTRLGDYLEIMSKAVFQAGLSWSQIDKHWDGFLEAFHNFDADKVAGYGEEDINRLMEHPEVVHSRKKIVATIANAKTILELDKQHGGFANYLRSKSSYEELSRDLRKKFKFLGDLSVYYFLFRVKEPVPVFEEWITTVEGHHPRMREMVEHARKKAETKNADSRN